MAEYKFDLTPFNLQNTKVYTFQEAETVSQSLDRPVGTRENPGRSLLGNHVIDNLQFEAGNFTNRQGESESFGALTLDAVLMRVAQKKNIVMTQIAGRTGTVKELISDSDYVIQIYGSVQTLDGSYPEDEVDRLIEICKAPVSLGVVSPFLQLFDITEIVITDYKFHQKQAYENQQIFEISALSDTSVELLLNSE
ncbi:MAG: DUF6046 domain-containing protein [Bacteroidota bacterium]